MSSADRPWPLPPDREWRLAMLGMVPGNGHPYSWSAIFNGYDRAAMAACPYAGIPEYLDKEPPATLRLPGARVTHLWCDRPEEAVEVARCALIPTVVAHPEEVIGEVDAVIIATDIGGEHVARCAPFVAAGLPVFVDKPLCDNLADLARFRRWVAAGRPILSSSCMRYAKEFLPYRLGTNELGDLRLATITTPKSYERYGIHALEAIYPIFGPGFTSVRYSGDARAGVVHLRHQRGADGVVVASQDMIGGFGLLTLAGTKGAVSTRFQDTFYAFKAQLAAFLAYLRSGQRPFPWAETEELMLLVAGGLRSRAEGGREVTLAELRAELDAAPGHG